MSGAAMRDLRVQLGWASVYAAAAILGRLTVLPATGFETVWPAAGVAILWLANSQARYWPAAVVAIGSLAAVIDAVSGAAAAELWTLAMANIVQGVAGAGALLWLYSSRPAELRPLSSLVDLWKLVIVGLVGSALSAVTVTIGFAFTDLRVWSVDDFLAWTGRGGVGTLAVVALGQLVMGSEDIASAGGDHRRPWVRSAATATRRAFEHRWREVAGLLAATIGVYWLAFVRYPELPLEFPLLAVTAWAGLRFSCILTHLHSLVTSTAVVVLTLAGLGPFAEIVSDHMQATVSQLFIGVVICFGLLLALGSQERRVANQLLERAHVDATDRAQLLSTVLEEMHDGMMVIDEDERVLMRNPASLRIAGMDDRMAVGPAVPRPAFEILAPDGEPIPADMWPYRRAFTTGRVVVQDLLIRPPDHDERYLQVAVTPLGALSKENRRLAVVLYHDANAEHEQLQALESFAGVVAHDLKAPLTVLRGWTELLQDAAAETELLPAAEVTQAAGHISDAATNMDQLIADLLVFSTARESTVHIEDVDLTTVAKAALEVTSAVKGSEGGKGRCTVHPLPGVRAEPVLMRQLFANLLGNAFKYARPGLPVVVDVNGERVGPDWVRIHVTDNGRGIPVEVREKIFEAFQRVPGTNQPGNGLGLAICRRIVDRYDGTITASENPDGPGTRFTVTLPAAQADPRSSEDVPSAA